MYKARGNTRRGKGVINKMISNLPLEMHLPGHNFTGPGTQLLEGKTRLNPDLSHKGWSKPINRVDGAAFNHDVCYLKNKDTKARNEVCDKEMLKELNEIPNPTLRERMERAIVKPIIWSKQKFGRGTRDLMGDIGKGLQEAYCLKCKRKTDTLNAEQTVSKNGRPMLKGICSVCQSKKSSFLKA